MNLIKRIRALWVLSGVLVKDDTKPPFHWFIMDKLLRGKQAVIIEPKPTDDVPVIQA